MKIRVRMDLAFNLVDSTQAETLRNELIPFASNAVNIHEGLANEERGYIDVEKCRHDEDGVCEKVARWEVGRGRVI